MGKLAQKLRKAREIRIVIGTFTIIARRPTDLEMIDLRGTGGAGRFMRFLIGWEGVKESDILDNEDPHDATFDADDAREWFADRPDLFASFTKQLLDSYQKHEEELEARLKNLSPGWSPAPAGSSQALSPPPTA